MTTPGTWVSSSADVGHDFVAAAAEFGIEADDDFRHVHALGVLVQFGPARAAAEGHSRPRMFFSRCSTIPAMRLEVSSEVPGGKTTFDLHSAFVKGRQEIAAQL